MILAINLTTIEREHKALVQQLAKDPILTYDKLGFDQVDCIHTVLGISGEAGELVDAIKKWAIYQKQLDHNNIIEELGDLEFYMQQLRSRLGITREQCLVHNIEKLNRRYPSGYTDKAAQEREDKV